MNITCCGDTTRKFGVDGNLFSVSVDMLDTVWSSSDSRSLDFLFVNWGLRNLQINSLSKHDLMRVPIDPS